MEIFIKENVIKFIAFTNIIFWILFSLTGVVTTFVTSNRIVAKSMSALCAWTSFFVLMVMFHKLIPYQSRKEFLKSLFAPKINWILFVAIIIVQFFLFFLTVGYVSIAQNIPLATLLNTSPLSLLIGMFSQIISGPIGEEPAYRGFLTDLFTKTKGIIKGIFIVGCIWGLWHFPLWLISGYKGVDLLIYILAFLTSIISATIIMGIIRSYNKNILYSISIHFLFNYSVSVVYTGSTLYLLVPFAIIYTIVAIVLIVICSIGSVQSTNLSAP